MSAWGACANVGGQGWGGIGVRGMVREARRIKGIEMWSSSSWCADGKRALVLDADMSTRFLVSACSVYFCPSACPQHKAQAELKEGERPQNSCRSVFGVSISFDRGQNIAPTHLPLHVFFL